jgi:hypothetical protein
VNKAPFQVLKMAVENLQNFFRKNLLGGALTRGSINKSFPPVPQKG